MLVYQELKIKLENKIYKYIHYYEVRTRHPKKVMLFYEGKIIYEKSYNKKIEKVKINKYPEISKKIIDLVTIRKVKESA